LAVLGRALRAIMGAVGTDAKKTPASTFSAAKEMLLEAIY
jgi:hypothetical protein